MEEGANMELSFEYFIECLQTGLKYIPFTLEILAAVFIFANIFAFIFATIRFYKIPVLSQIVSVFVAIWLGIPSTLSLVVAYLLVLTNFSNWAQALHLPWGIKDVNFVYVAAIVLIITYSCPMSENFRGAYKAIGKVQFEAGYSIGLTEMQTLRRIIIPQLIPIMMPTEVNWLIIILKNISLISAIGLVEIMGGCLLVCARTYSYFEGYMAAAVIYWIMAIIIEQIGKRMEKYSGKHRRQNVC